VTIPGALISAVSRGGGEDRQRRGAAENSLVIDGLRLREEDGEGLDRAAPRRRVVRNAELRYPEAVR
jgi:hypothetical protein